MKPLINNIKHNIKNLIYIVIVTNIMKIPR